MLAYDSAYSPVKISWRGPQNALAKLYHHDTNLEAVQALIFAIQSLILLILAVFARGFASLDALEVDLRVKFPSRFLRA